VSGTLAGQAACLSAALLWAVSVSLFRKPIEKYGAPTINLAKCLLATVLQGVTVWALGRADSLWSASSAGLALIAGSGLVGLVVGDTALFAAVSRIGVHRTLLLQTLAPAFAAIAAYLWLGEKPTLAQTAGAILILAGIALVVAPSGSARATRPWGLSLGILAALGQGGGIVMAKVGMAGVDVLAASCLRLFAAAAGLALVGLLTKRFGLLWSLTLDLQAIGRVVPAITMGTYIALFLMMAGIAMAPASIAAVLLSTTPVFSLFIEAFVERRPVSLRGLAGTLIAVAGVAVLSNA
jgi:drug/metabolite transporter (DMT)-like permease